MRILAFSDLHGRHYREASELIDLHHPDWIVLLGDLLPDFDLVSGLGNRLECQRAHWKAHGHAFMHAGLPTTFIRGNHEVEGFSVPESMAGIPLEWGESVMRLEGIPAEFGTFGWSREWEGDALKAEIQKEAHGRIRVVLSHVPPLGCLDEPEPGSHIGHRPLRDWLDSEDGESVELVLCGHVHEALGFARCRNALVVNLATGYALLDDAEGAWRVGRIESLPSFSAQQRLLSEDLD